MPRFRFPRRVAIGVSLGIAAACMSVPSFADTPVMVDFQPHNPWTQELGSVSRYDSSHDYSVTVEAGKTLQINLVTRDPNVFFKVKNETQDKRLVDTYETGATTWSTPNPTAAAYTIHVYVVPDAMQRGEKADYALQVGQYGAEDMQAATTTVTFQNGNPWAQEVGSVDAHAPMHDYTVAMTAGKTLQVNLVTRNPNLHFKVEDKALDKVLVDSGKTAATTWSTPVAAAATYTISVYADPAAMQPGQNMQYALQVGQYGTANTQPATPATAGSTAVSAVPAALPPHASTAVPASAGSVVD